MNYKTREFAMQNLLHKGCYIFRLCGQTAPVGPRIGRRYGKGLVNFVPKSRLPFVKISSIYRKTMAQAWNWYELGIKNDFEEIEHEFAFGIFRPEK